MAWHRVCGMARCGMKRHGMASCMRHDIALHRDCSEARHGTAWHRTALPMAHGMTWCVRHGVTSHEARHGQQDAAWCPCDCVSRAGMHMQLSLTGGHACQHSTACPPVRPDQHDVAWNGSTPLPNNRMELKWAGPCLCVKPGRMDLSISR
eukprot:364341-Chlamydomonas_euryale.AAC.18